MHPDEPTLNLSQAARAAGRPPNYFVRQPGRIGAERGRISIRALEASGVHVPDDVRRAARPFGDFLPRDHRTKAAPRRGRPRGPALPGTKLLSIEQACLELNVSSRTVYRMRDAGDLRIVTLSRGCAGVPRTDVDAYLARVLEAAS